MSASDIALQRLANQHLITPQVSTPTEVVAWQGALQAQDYAGAKWAIGQRLPDTNDAALDEAFAKGAFLRTHILRPTWHFVAPQDLRWMLELTAPRVKMKFAYYNRQLELDDAIFARSNDVLVKALRDGEHLTRAELEVVLQQAGIRTDDLRMVHLMANAELDGLVCSGAMRGKQFTYALLDKRVQSSRWLTRGASLPELTRRYFTSRGPATVQDYVWWSGLTVAEAREGIEAIKAELVAETIDGETYWSVPTAFEAPAEAPTVCLLPNYDEYIVGYADRSAIYDEQHADKLDARGNVLFNNTIALDGMIVGTWKRTLKKREVVVEPTFFVELNPVELEAFEQAAQRYSDYLGLAVMLKS